MCTGITVQVWLPASQQAIKLIPAELPSPPADEATRQVGWVCTQTLLTGETPPSWFVLTSNRITQRLTSEEQMGVMGFYICNR